MGTLISVRRRSSRVLVVEDDTLVRAVLDRALRENGWDVETVSDGLSIEEMAATFRPDVTVIDVGLPVGPDGYEIARRLRAASDTSLLFLTAADDEEHLLAGFAAGADDYMGKPFSMPELLARLQALVRRDGNVMTGGRRIGDITVDDDSGTVSRNGRVIELSKIEYALLSQMSRRQGRVFTRTELLGLVWQYEGGNTDLVEVHISSLRRKLEEHGPRLIHTARARGYAFRPSAAAALPSQAPTHSYKKSRIIGWMSSSRRSLGREKSHARRPQAVGLQRARWEGSWSRGGAYPSDGSQPSWLAAIVQSSQEAIVGYGLDGTIVSWNPGATHLFGYSQADAVGRSVSLTVPPDRLHEIEAALDRLRAGRPSAHLSTIRATKNGTPVEVDVTLSPIRDAKGEVVGLASVARDATEHRWMARALDQIIVNLEAALEQAQESEARSRRFLADVAHRLRNLTTGLEACADLVLRSPRRRGRDALLREMLSETAVVNRYVRALLRMARLDDNGEAPKRRPCDVLALCRSQADRAAALAPGLKVTHRTSGLSSLPSLDPTAVEEIVGNLLDNARRHAASRIEVSVEAVGDVIEIRVVDDGAGLSQELAARAFERFVSLDDLGGSGLGLPIARALARAHGGDLSYQEPKGGFLVQLPLSSNAGGTPA